MLILRKKLRTFCRFEVLTDDDDWQNLPGRHFFVPKSHFSCKDDKNRIIHTLSLKGSLQPQLKIFRRGLHHRKWAWNDLQSFLNTSFFLDSGRRVNFTCLSSPERLKLKHDEAVRSVIQTCRIMLTSELLLFLGLFKKSSYLNKESWLIRQTIHLESDLCCNMMPRTSFYFLPNKNKRSLKSFILNKLCKNKH